MGLSDNLFKRIENKTNIDKETILSLANKLGEGNMKDEKTIKEIISSLSKMTGKSVTKEQEDKIISAIVNDKVPKNISEYY